MIFTEKKCCATFVKDFEIVEIIHDNNDKTLETKLGTNYLILLNNYSTIENLFHKYIDILIENKNLIHSNNSSVAFFLDNLKDELYESLKNTFISNLIHYDLLNEFNNEYNMYNNLKNDIKNSNILIKRLKNAIKTNDTNFIDDYILVSRTDKNFKTLYNSPSNKKTEYIWKALKDEQNRLSDLKRIFKSIDIETYIKGTFAKILNDILRPLLCLTFNLLTIKIRRNPDIAASHTDFNTLFKNVDGFSNFLKDNRHCLQIPKSYHDYCVIDQNTISFPDVYSYNNYVLTNYTLYTLDSIKDFCDASVKHIIDNGLKIVECENCNKFFIPANRSDEKYCSNISPQNPNKTCKEYGAKKAYRDKVNSNKIKKSHYNTSQFFRMKIKRAKTEKEVNLYTNLFDSYKSTYEKQKKKYNNKKLSEKDFVEWIIAQKNIN